MSQNTRQDKRAQVLSLLVRYKNSATVDDFIEHHSHDVSSGGVFVRSAAPFAPGVLLRFELRLAGDVVAVSGTGRVVWKREPAQATAKRPAGMAVAFVKLDDASRAIIDKLVAEKADAGELFTSDSSVNKEPGPPGTQPARGTPAQSAPALPASLGAEKSAPVTSTSSTGSSAEPSRAPLLQPKPPRAPPLPTQKPAVAETPAAPIPAKVPAATPPNVARGDVSAPHVAAPPAPPVTIAHEDIKPKPVSPNIAQPDLGEALPSLLDDGNDEVEGIVDSTALMPSAPGTAGMLPKLSDDDDDDGGKGKVRESTVVMPAAALMREALRGAGASFSELAMGPPSSASLRAVPVAPSSASLRAVPVAPSSASLPAVPVAPYSASMPAVPVAPSSASIATFPREPASSPRLGDTSPVPAEPSTPPAKKQTAEPRSAVTLLLAVIAVLLVLIVVLLVGGGFYAFQSLGGTPATTSMPSPSPMPTPTPTPSPTPTPTPAPMPSPTPAPTPTPTASDSPPVPAPAAAARVPSGAGTTNAASAPNVATRPPAKTTAPPAKPPVAPVRRPPPAAKAPDEEL